MTPPAPQTAVPDTQKSTASLLIARHPGRTVYDINPIRREIITHLELPDLARFIRVEKGCFWDVARVLYHSMTYDQAAKVSSPDVARQEAYLGAVIDMDALSMSITKKNTSHVGKRLPIRTLGYGDVEVIHSVVPAVRQRYPYLRTIRFGTRPSSSSIPRGRPRSNALDEPKVSCIINFRSAKRPEASGELGVIGTIEFFTTCIAQLNEVPPTHIQAPTCPPGTYEQGTGFSNLNTRLEVVCSGITLDHLTRIYQRQMDGGYAERLKYITATPLARFDMGQFRTFARTASASLTSLILARGDRVASNSSLVARIRLADLASFSLIVREYLPNLTQLYIAMSDIDAAERHCGRLLYPGGLCIGGSISDLMIYAAGRSSDNLYKLIRVLSTMCKATAEIDIRGQHWTTADQTAYLRVLRAQPPARRIHLATVDFKTLSITKPDQVTRLTYYDDGRLKSLLDGWRDSSTLAVQRAPAAVKTLQAELRRCARAARRLSAVEPGATAGDKVAAAEKLLDAVEVARAAAEAVLGWCDYQGEDDVLDYIIALQADLV
ncbi:uncharacterized protein MKK02DRAFT_38051 [Dioszegia hungarica]|uniref:Uncharacterized protein n=1 Tax=Dioszegia hungarica TaxID=4972 RepID=A0AA38H5L7_9TREE|nr:uncharacterized protein MKK02DRAFT_38051 [Dioszegia hungarica]KAI9634520.1 hypothetical protein MKK02DRAFT_38051 [Dioszegia hungarica]